MTSPPALSIIMPLLARSSSWPTARDALRAQTIADQLELVVVSHLIDPLSPNGKPGGLHERIVAVAPEVSRSEALAVGVRAASAEIVVFAEDHAFPEPDWAAALLDAHTAGRVAVAPAVANANPTSALSWANLLLGYGRWVPPIEGGLLDELPAHHASYRRAILLERAEALPALIGREGRLQAELQARGHELTLEPRAVVRHLNASTLRGTIDLRVNAGRLYAAHRARREGWSPARRLLYAVGSPLIPAVRFVRITQELRSRTHDLTPRVLAGTAVGVALDGVGQLIGYAGGEGTAAGRIERLDLDRARSCSRRDRRELIA
jgi:hypothetical protein